MESSVRVWGALGALACGMAWGVACTPPLYCPYVTSVFDGQTGLEPDVVVSFYLSDEVPASAPSLAPGLSLVEESSGRSVPFDVVVEGTVVQMVPVAPLEDGKTYTATGISEWAIEGVHSSVFFLTDDVTMVTFTVGSRPAWIDLVVEPETDSWLMVFSEDVERDELGQLEVSVDGVMVVIDLADQARLYDDTPHILEVPVPDEIVAITERADLPRTLESAELSLSSGWPVEGRDEAVTMQAQSRDVAPYLLAPYCI